MGLEIYGHGVAGEILVEDQRSDGSVILLQCTPYGKTSSTTQPGVTVASSEGGSWPMLQEAGVARRRRGKLHLDTTQMPGGVLSFNISILAEKAARALDSGVRFIELTLENAEEWGYSGPVRPTGPETSDAEATAHGVETTARRTKASAAAEPPPA